MARLLGSDDLQRVTANPPSGVAGWRAGVGQEATAEALQAIGGAGQDLQQAGNRGIALLRQKQDSNNRLAYATAGSNLAKTILETKDSLSQDPDYSTYQKRYDDVAGKALEEQAATIQDPDLQKQFRASAKLDIAQGWSDLAKVGHAKEADARVANLNDLVTQNLDTASKLRDPAARAKLVQQTGQAIDAMADGGWISRDDAARQKRAFTQDYATNYLNSLPAAERLAALTGQGGASQAQRAAVEAMPAAPEVSAAIAKGAKSDGDAALLSKIAMVESGGNPAAVNPQSGAAGLFQFMPGTAKQYGVADPTDPQQATAGAQKLLDANRKALTASLGRAPTDGELYLAHQQGATGAAALLANPDKSAISVLTAVYGDAGKAKAAVMQNGGSEGMTAGQFAGMWTAKLGDKAAPVLEPPAGGYDLSKPTGTVADLLPVDARLKMIAGAQSDVKQDLKDQQQALQAQVAIQYDDQKRNAFLTGTADPTFKAQVMAAYPDEKGAAYVQAIDHEADVGGAYSQIKANTQAQDDALLARAKASAAVPGTGSADAADTYKRLSDAIDAKRKALADEVAADIKDSQGESVEAINKNSADWMQTAAQTGVVPDEAKVAVAEAGSDEAKAFLGKLDQAAQLGRDRQQLETQPQSADKTMLERYGLQAESTGPGSGAMAAEAKTVTEAIQKKTDAIQNDAAGYFESVSPALKSAWDAVDANPQDVSVAQTAAAMTMAAQADYGLPADQQQPLPNARAAQYANTIMTAQPDQAMATIDQVRALFGDTALKQVLGQKGVPAMAKFLAFADLPAQEPVRAAALNAMKLTPEELDKQVKARGFKDKDIDDQVQSVIRPLMDTLTPGAVGPYQDALTQITKYYVSQGLKPSNAAQQAWSAFKAAYTFHGTYRVPTQIDGQPIDDQKVTDGLSSVMQHLDQFGIVPQPGAPENAPEGYALKQTISQLQHGGLRWVTNPDDTGVIATYDVDQNGLPGPAVKTTTGRLELSFADLASGKYGSAPARAVTGKGSFPTGGQ